MGFRVQHLNTKPKPQTSGSRWHSQDDLVVVLDHVVLCSHLVVLAVGALLVLGHDTGPRHGADRRLVVDEGGPAAAQAVAEQQQERRKGSSSSRRKKGRAAAAAGKEGQQQQQQEE